MYSSLLKGSIALKRGAFMLLLVLFCAPLMVVAEEENSLVIRAGEAHIGDGRVIENALVVIENGVIVSISSGAEAPEGTKVLEVPVITPGFIDANVRLDVEDAIFYPGEDPRLTILRALGKEQFYHGGDVCPCGTSCPAQMQHVDDEPCLYCGWPDHDPHGNRHDLEQELLEGAQEARAAAAGVPDSSAVINEQSSEVVPHFQVLDAVDLGSDDFDRLLREGVTTVYISPDSSAVVGARGALMRTGGDVSERFIGSGAVKAVLGSDAYRYGSSNRPPFRTFVSVYTRRPASRMGVSWVFRKAFHDALLRGSGHPVSGADTSSPEASDVLARVLTGEIPLRIQARTGPDIETAFRLCKEFGISFTLEDPVEAWKRVDLLSETGVPVIYGPIFDIPSGILSGSVESRQSRLNTVRDLASAGIHLALSAQDLRGEEGLARQAMLAIRYGVDPAEAMRMVTLYPSRLLGLDKEVGTLDAGKRADVVVWNGSPFSSLSRIETVIHGGAISFDRN
ncbi:MAG: amidohydrolase family protein [Planctomycetes bacterium]|nr:amidohydrolase family protein [Planctomycetota bacterium]